MEQGPTPMKLDRAEIKNKIKMEPIKSNKGKSLNSLTNELKHIYKKNGQCFIYRKKGHLAHDCRIKDRNHNEVSQVEKVNIKEAITDNNKTSSNTCKRYSESDDIPYHEISLNKEVYNQIREEYQNDTYLVKVKEALEYSEEKDAK
ncbi:42173_t:CDS:2 [Gigaspora margarita]|uniref:42173_t:CDS:1 n=1 Tax=Gigaspora margarita TaxID=4874 RepID=A0ABN7UM23_GIGMA|nr:42173_t:CDS:2 [Gigaspora margarita]